MKNSRAIKFRTRVKLCALALVFVWCAAAAGAPAPAQHEMHGSHASTPSPRKKRAAAKRTTRRMAAARTAAVKKARRPARARKTSAATRRNAALRAAGARAGAHAHQQAPPATGTPEAPAAPHDAHAAGAHHGRQPSSPAPAPGGPPPPQGEPPHDSSHRGQAGTTHDHERPSDTTTRKPVDPVDPSAHAGRHDGKAVEAPRPTADGSAPGGVDHSAHGPAQTPAPAGVEHSAHGAPAAGGAAGNPDELLVMSGDEMGIRVGASASNFTPMGQMGSGTAWQPSSSPMYMWHRRAGDWLLMLHGEAKLGVNSQGGPRGVTKFESQNWIMPMAFRRVGRGTLQLRGMFSLEPLTFSGAGSPQIFQTGEVYRGRPLVDAQHPHDLFMELSAQYTMPVGERGTWFAYFGFPGEPALGPVAFMHRASASENPTAPLAHHFQDSTHISFGVLTSGFTYRWLKVEGSVFNGREPDEDRYGFELNPWNSRSVRVSVAPNRNWTMQYSYGLLKDPELLHAGDTRRQTASVQYNKNFARGHWATSLIWGRNREEHEDDGEVFRLNGYTAESTVNFLDKNYLYTRLELVDRKELLGHDELHELGFGEGAHPTFRVGAYTFGGARDIWATGKLSFALGGDATFYSKPAALDAVYGRSPTSYKFFLRIRPGKMRMDHGGHSSN